MKTKWQLTCYTRSPLEADIYSEKLAYSMHLALKNNESSFEPLNDDSGLLFAKAIEQKEGTLLAKSLINPIIFQDELAYGVLAKRVEADGNKEESKEVVYLYYTTSNFIEYELKTEISIRVDDDITLLDCVYDAVNRTYTLYWENKSDTLLLVTENLCELNATPSLDSFQFPYTSLNEWERPDIVQGNTIEIDQNLAIFLKNKLSHIQHVETDVPKQVVLSTVEELWSIKAELTYSDGSKSFKTVEWDLDSLQLSTSNRQKVNGKVKQSYFKFPLAINRADPNIFYYNNLFYYIATDDTTNGNLNFYVRCAATIEELTSAADHLILNNTMYPELNKFLWAPELHLIDDKVYILFASSPHEFGEIRCHVMGLKDNGNIIKHEDWESPKVFLREDGEQLFSEGITLDMTYIQFDDNHYVLWAQRQLRPVDNGSWLYIATISPQQPWQLTSEPVVISKPEYGWANNQTFVDEGPYGIIKDDTLYVTFSSALVNATYCVGIMSIKKGDDLLDARYWKKRQYPILTSRTIKDQFGPGHNSYVTDLDGTLLNVYHAKPNINGPRSTGIRPVHFGFDGEPILKMTESQYLNEALTDVTIEVSLTNTL